jgi:programmed cell death protein 5
VSRLSDPTWCAVASTAGAALDRDVTARASEIVFRSDRERVSMSGSPDDDRLEELREQKLQELQDRAGGDGDAGAEARQEAQQRAEAQQEAVLKQYLTDGARQRLNAVEMSKPDFAKQVKQQVASLAQSGRVQGRIDEDQMRDLLKELQPEQQSFDIRRR